MTKPPATNEADESKTEVRVTNMPPAWSQVDLTNLFEAFGAVEEACVGGGEGIVEYESSTAAATAVAQMNNFEAEPGFKLSVEFAE